MKLLVVILLLLMQAAAIVAYYESKGSSQGSQLFEEHPGRTLLATQQLVEGEFEKYLSDLKLKVKTEFESKDLQKLSRSKVRKNYAFETKAQSQAATLRYSVYTVDARREPGFRKVYEDFKSALVWNKIMEMLVSQALKSSGEESGDQSDSKMEKFSEMISMVMKDNGLAKIQEPGNFNEFSLFGEDTVFYWNTIMKKCPSRVRKQLGIEKCVKGLFLAEIDRKNMVRDFAQLESVKGKIHALALVDKKELLELYPIETAYHSKLADAIGRALQSDSRQYYENSKGAESLVVFSRAIPSAMLAIPVSKKSGDQSQSGNSS